MIKAMVFTLFLAVVIIVAYSVMLDSKIEHIDQLVKRGIQPQEAYAMKWRDRIMEYLTRRK